MTTMLEKAAAALWEADPNNPPFDSLTPGRFSWNLAHDQARAALLAIREPTLEMCRSGDQAGSEAVAAADEWAAHDRNVHESQPPAMFTAMIDAILNEGTSQ